VHSTVSNPIIRIPLYQSGIFVFIGMLIIGSFALLDKYFNTTPKPNTTFGGKYF
jgi:hypothetical protein